MVSGAKYEEGAKEKTRQEIRLVMMLLAFSQILIWF